MMASSLGTKHKEVLLIVYICTYISLLLRTVVFPLITITIISLIDQVTRNAVLINAEAYSWKKTMQVQC